MRKSFGIVAMMALASSGCTTAAPPSAAPLTTLGMSQTVNGWGAGEEFDLQLRADGTAFLSVHKYGKGGRHTQRFRGAFSQKSFAQLAAQFRARKFFDLAKRYEVGATEQATTTLRAATREYSREVSSYGDESYGSAAPPNFHQLVALLHDARAKIKWRAFTTRAAKP